MRSTTVFLMVLAMLGCMKKQADGTYKVDTAHAKAQTKKSTDDLKKAAKHAEEKTGEALQKAGEKLKQNAKH
jgi:TRAP-type C4-dicarboxylate transport system substrate-binding protein